MTLYSFRKSRDEVLKFLRARKRERLASSSGSVFFFFFCAQQRQRTSEPPRRQGEGERGRAGQVRGVRIEARAISEQAHAG